MCQDSAGSGSGGGGSCAFHWFLVCQEFRPGASGEPRHELRNSLCSLAWEEKRNAEDVPLLPPEDKRAPPTKQALKWDWPGPMGP